MWLFVRFTFIVFTYYRSINTHAIDPKSNVVDKLSESTTPLAIVSAVDPVTSPVCVALVTLDRI